MLSADGICILLEQLRSRCEELSVTWPEQCALVTHHLDVLERCLQACWVWQTYTHRYKRNRSIWQETTISPSFFS